MAHVRISVQQYPAGVVVATKTNKQRLPTDPLTQHQLHFHTWHLLNKRLHCGCMRRSYTLREPFVSAHSAELLHPRGPLSASVSDGWGIGPGIRDFVYLPGAVHNLPRYISSCVFTGFIFKILWDIFISDGRGSRWGNTNPDRNCLCNLS